MKKIRFSAVFLFLMLWTITAFSAAGGSSGLTLAQPVCARAVSMGDAYTAVSDDINAVYYNPAGLVLFNRKEFSTSYLKGVLDFTYYSAGFYSSYNNDYAFGGNLSVFSAGVAEINNLDGTVDNVKALEDSVYTATLAKKMGDGFSAGVNARCLSSTIAQEFKNEAYPFDIGLLYRINNPKNKFGFGFCMQNFGGNLKSSLAQDEGEKLPSVTRAGISYTSKSPGKNVTIAADALQFQEEPNLKIHLGLEYALVNKLALRAGYKIGYDLA
ncbi:MAG: hypothetical protein A3J83_04445, partial [Elusimicrobia bacterium RIFOXYA2_FULL_40_6]